MNKNHRTISESSLLRSILPSITGRGLGVGLFLLLASLTLGACSSDDDDDNVGKGYNVTNVAEAPTWQVDYSGSDSRPDWQEPNPSAFENWTIMLVELEDELKPYTSNEDLLALFIGGEIRGLTSPALSTDVNDKGTFVLKAYGNEADQNMVNLTLCYYSSQLKQTFSRTVQMRYEMGKVYGLEENLVPHFTLGTAKYPVLMNLNVSTYVTKAEILPAQGDYFAAFVGEECRGVSSAIDTMSFIVYGRQEGESITLKYYQAATGKVFTFPNVVQIQR